MFAYLTETNGSVYCGSGTEASTRQMRKQATPHSALGLIVLVAHHIHRECLEARQRPLVPLLLRDRPYLCQCCILTVRWRSGESAVL